MVDIAKTTSVTNVPKAPYLTVETKEITPEPIAVKTSDLPNEPEEKAEIKVDADVTTKPVLKIISKSDDTAHFKAVCKICGARMKSNAALGGHTSKAHPNESTTFQRKMQRREERALDREMLAAAKEVFSKLNPDKDISSSRSRIAFYKSKIRQSLNGETPAAIKAAQQEIYSKYRKPEIKKPSKPSSKRSRA